MIGDTKEPQFPWVCSGLLIWDNVEQLGSVLIKVTLLWSCWKALNEPGLIMICLLIWRRTKSSLSLISSRWSHNPLGGLPSCSGYYYSTPSLLLHCAGGQIFTETHWISHSASLGVASTFNCQFNICTNVSRTPKYRLPTQMLTFTPSTMCCSLPQNLNLDFLSINLPVNCLSSQHSCFSSGVFSCASFNQGFQPPPDFELRYRSTRGRTHNAARALFGPASFRGGIDPPSLFHPLYLFSSSKLFIQ